MLAAGLWCLVTGLWLTLPNSQLPGASDKEPVTIDRVSFVNSLEN